MNQFEIKTNDGDWQPVSREQAIAAIKEVYADFTVIGFELMDGKSVRANGNWYRLKKENRS